MKAINWISAVLALLVFASPALAQQTHPEIEVSGTATISIVPDRITVEIGMEEYFKHSYADSAKVSIRAIEAQVREILRTSGVKDTLVTVTDVGNYSDRRTSDRFLMAKRLSAVITDFDQLDKIAGSLPERGVASFSISKLDNSDMARYNREGLKSALDAARGKAEFIAGNEGMTGLAVWKVEETSPGYSVPRTFSNVAYAGGSGMDNMRRIERQYSVRVTYRFTGR